MATAGRIGPNAVIQVAAALRAIAGDGVAADVLAAAGVTALPEAMTDEAQVRAVHQALAAMLPSELATRVASEAGRRTGDYVLTHRIPGAAKLVLHAAPRPIAARLLLKAIARHAWTFAGSGVLATQAGAPCLVEIARNPIAVPGCPWHVAVLERLFRTLVAPATRVRSTACCAMGDPVCRFEIDLNPRRA